MSNIISNKLIINGNQELIGKCLTGIKPAEQPFNNSPIDFEKIIPLKNGEYGENIWGCKKNASYPVVSESGIPSTDCSIGFYTLAKPPIPVITALSKQYPELEFILKYCDEWFGCSEIGIAIFKNGLVVANKSAPELFGKERSEWLKLITELFPLAVDYTFTI